MFLISRNKLRIPFLDNSFWISLTVFELFCYGHFVIRQDHGYGSSRTNWRYLFATKTRCFCFSIRLQDKNKHCVTMKSSGTWTAQLTVASSKAQHYLNSLYTAPKRPPSKSKFYVDFFKKIFFKDQKIETHLLFLDVLRLVRHFFELTWTLVFGRFASQERTNVNRTAFFSSHAWFLAV